jgi:hypothetical protein
MRKMSPKVPETIQNFLRGAYSIQMGEEMRIENMDEEASEFDIKMRFCGERDNLFEVINNA